MYSKGTFCFPPGFYICIVRYFILYILLLLAACKPAPEKDKGSEAMEGKWLVVYPDEQLRNETEEKIYAAIQDSLVELKGLKLVAFDKDGLFYQADDIKRNGAWLLNTDKHLLVDGGGKGFAPFRATLSQLSKESMILTERVKYEGELLVLDWHLVRLDAKTAAVLFDDANNKWRMKSADAETSSALKERLISVLNFYAAYFLLLKEKASYFIPGRIVLPFQFYQHAVGLRPLKRCPEFRQLFYDSLQAVEAHGYLENGMQNLSGKFPHSDEDNYVHEYAMYMKLLAEEMRKM